MARLSDIDKAFIDENYEGTSCRKMVELLYLATGNKTNKTSIQDYYHLKGYKSGLTGKFNKNFEGLEEEKINNIKRTQYKKGNVSLNYKPIGTVSKRADYVYVKVGERTWRLMHDIVWEKYHGPKPKGSKLIHIDGDVYNNDIENLMLISDSEELKVNRIGLTNDKELNKVIISTAKLQDKLFEKR